MRFGFKPVPLFHIFAEKKLNTTMEEKIKRLLASVVHPETGQDIVSSGFIEHTASAEGKVTVVLRFAKARDPFAVKIKNQAESLLREAFPGAEVLVVIKEGGAAPRPEPKLKTTTGGIARVIAVASGKGGVGKSTVTANLAIALRNMGFRVGVLDADIYGPSQPKMFGVEGYVPEAVAEDGVDHIVPAESMDVKLMSIGFFINPKDALMWRGPMAINALRQMIRQTLWGELDFLLIDMPPGTGDIHLSILQEMSLSGAIIVSTPQKMALADVIRGISMFRNEKIGIPVLGLVENMAWFTPEELPDHKYYLFGKEGTKRLAEEEHLPLLAQIPLIQNIRESSDEGKPVSTEEGLTSEYYRLLAKRMIEELDKQQQHGKS